MPTRHHTPPARPEELSDKKLAELWRGGKTAAAAFLHSILWVEYPSTDFRITLDWETAVPLLARMSPCNDFCHRRVLGALLHVDRLIPRADFGPNNPNTGMRTYDLALGCEGSNVMYLTRHERLGEDGLTEEQIREIEWTMTWAQADEVGHEVRANAVDGYRVIEFRFWWD